MGHEDKSAVSSISRGLTSKRNVVIMSWTPCAHRSSDVLLWATPPGFKIERRKALHPRLHICFESACWKRKGERMFAVIKSGGRQYKVAVGQTFEVNRLPVEDGAQVKFEEVLLISDADRSMVGTPLVDNAVVLATATRQSRGEKLIVFKYKSKKRQRHRRGQRQKLKQYQKCRPRRRLPAVAAQQRLRTARPRRARVVRVVRVGQRNNKSWHIKRVWVAPAMVGIATLKCLV